MTSIADATTARSFQAAPEPELVEVDGGRGRVDAATLRELWRFRDVLLAFTTRLVKVKYKQAILGFGWSIFQPIVSALLFALFMGRFVRVGSEGVAYVLFALCGTACWTFFSGSLTNALESVLRESSLVRKIYFPRELLPISAIGAGLVDFMPALVTVLVAAAIGGYFPALTWLALPVAPLLLALTALGLGIGLSALNVYYRDVRYVLPFLIQAGLFATPVIYSLGKIPPHWRTAYAALNPPAAAIDLVRRTVLHHEWPLLPQTLGALGWSLVLVFVGYSVFKRLERGFADRI